MGVQEVNPYTDDEERLCVICLVNERNTTVLPCRYSHLLHHQDLFYNFTETFYAPQYLVPVIQSHRQEDNAAKRDSRDGHGVISDTRCTA